MPVSTCKMLAPSHLGVIALFRLSLIMRKFNSRGRGRCVASGGGGGVYPTKTFYIPCTKESSPPPSNETLVSTY